MLILIIDTTVDACSVALARDGTVLATESEARRRGHAEELIPMIQRVTAAAGVLLADLDHILVTTGPGTFTGVRIGVSAARGLGLAIEGATLCGLDTLQALALSLLGQVPPGREKLEAGAIVVAAIDARRGDLYAAIYKVVTDDQAPGTPPLATLMPPSRCTAADVTDALAAYPADIVRMAGSGAALLHDGAAPGVVVPDVVALAPWAEIICANFDQQGVVAPLYLRPPDATLPRPTALQMATRTGPQETP